VELQGEGRGGWMRCKLALDRGWKEGAQIQEKIGAYLARFEHGSMSEEDDRDHERDQES
jgi:hypothetical protein